MKWFANLKTAYKLSIGFGLGIVITILVGSISIARMGNISDELNQIYKDEVMVGKVGEVRGDLLNSVRAEKNLLLSHDAAQNAKWNAAVADYSREFEKDLSDMKAMAYTEKAKLTVDLLESEWAEKAAGSRKIAEMVQARHVNEAQQLSLSSSVAHVGKMESAIKEFISFKDEQGKKSNAAVAGMVAASRFVILSLIGLSILSGTLICWFITRCIARPLAQVGERMQRLQGVCVTNLNGAMKALAQGDLTVTVTPTTTPLDINQTDEVGAIAATFNIMLEQTKSTLMSYEDARKALTGLIGQVAQSAEAVASTSTQLSMSAEQTGKASEEIARSMQEVASAANQSATTSQEMAKGSEQQARSATEAADEMENLHATVQQVQSRGQEQQVAAHRPTRECIRRPLPWKKWPVPPSRWPTPRGRRPPSHRPVEKQWSRRLPACGASSSRCRPPQQR